VSYARRHAAPRPRRPNRPPHLRQQKSGGRWQSRRNTKQPLILQPVLTTAGLTKDGRVLLLNGTPPPFSRAPHGALHRLHGVADQPRGAPYHAVHGVLDARGVRVGLSSAIGHGGEGDGEEEEDDSGMTDIGHR
jgi:hypothetical protein